MTQIKLRRDTAANFTSKNPVLGVGEPAYETDTKKLKIGDGTTTYNSLPYFSMTDEFATYREKYGAPSDSVPVVNTGNSITIKANVSIETPNGTLTNATDMTYSYDFLTDRVLFVTENDYYHAYAVYYGGKEPSPVGEQIFWFNNNIWTMISGDGTKTVFNTQKITPIAKIYQVNGTVKNIDYSSYTKISAGGGGSTNISATLPLKIVDGVISLEVDGQTIQIVDGKLHANLDELGNEVNNLSGRVAAAEADILTKQDILTPIQPLTIQSKIISNLVGMEYTGDGTGVYGTYSLESSNGAFGSGNLGNNTNFGSSWSATSIPCYIDIPYTFGQIVKVPSGTYGYTWNKSIGKLLADGTFVPICTFYPSEITTSDTLKSFTQYRATWDTKSVGKTSGDSFSVANGQAGCSYIQFIDNGSTIRCLAYYGNGEGVPSSSIDYTVTDNNDIQRIREIQVVRVFPNRQDYGVSSNPYPVDRFGLYDGVTTLDTLGDFNNLGENLFDLSGQVAKNYLELSIGSGLAITDGKLTASSTAPSNMVTTDTKQDITGEKSFTTGKTKFKNQDSDRKILGEINGNGFYCNYFTDKASGEKPCYLGKVSQSVFNLGIPGVTGVEGRIFAKTLTKWDRTNEVGTILDSSNLGSYVDGTTITYTNNKLSATSGADMPSSKYIDLTLGASGTTYTAPANGYLSYIISPQSTDMYFELNGLLCTGSYGGGSIVYGYHGFLPLRKGEVVTIAYKNCSTSLFRFVYAEGSK